MATLRPRSETAGQHVIQHETGPSPVLSASGLCTRPHQAMDQQTNHLWSTFIGVYRDGKKVMNSLRPFKQSNLRSNTINLTFLRDVDGLTLASLNETSMRSRLSSIEDMTLTVSTPVTIPWRRCSRTRYNRTTIGGPSASFRVVD